MRKIISLISLLTLCAIMVLLFASCGGEQTTDTSSQEKSTATITLDLDGGVIIGASQTTIEAQIGEKLTPFDEPVKIGYTFKCWIENGEAISFPYTVKGDTTLVACWESLIEDSDTESETETESLTDTTTEVESETDTETELETNTDSETATETEKPEESDTETETESLTDTTTEVESETDTETELETNTDSETVTETETETEVDTESDTSAIPSKVTLTFKSFGGNFVIGSETKVATPGAKLVIIPEVEKEGYEFVSWVTEDGESIGSPLLVPNENTTYYAFWKEITIADTETDTDTEVDTETETDTETDTETEEQKELATVWIHLEGGAFASNIKTKYEVEIGSTISLTENPTKTGYTFVCWIENSQQVTFPYTVKGDALIVATWKIIPETDEGSSNCGAHEFGAWLRSKDPDCLGFYEETRECFTCGGTETRVLEGEKKGKCEYTNWAVALEPGCVENGVSARVCKNCSKIETQSIDKITHEESDWTHTTPAGCLLPGEDTCNCRCEQKRVVEALGHNIDRAPGEAPTETSEGYTSYWECTRCGINGGDEAVGDLSTVENIAKDAKFSHNATDFHAFQPDKLYDGKEDNGTRSPKGGDYSIFMDYMYEQYITYFKLKCNGGGSIPYGTTDLVYNIKNISINFYGIDGKMVHTTGKTDVSSSEYIECEVNQFVTRVEIQIFDGSHGGGEYLWEVYVMAAKTYLEE